MFLLLYSDSPRPRREGHQHGVFTQNSINFGGHFSRSQANEKPHRLQSWRDFFYISIIYQIPDLIY